MPQALFVDQSAFKELWKLHPTTLGACRVHNTTETPRYFVNYGSDYKFGGVNHKGVPYDVAPQFIQVMAKFLWDVTGFPYDEILVNWYSGKDQHYIGWHSDSEHNLVRVDDLPKYLQPPKSTLLGIFSFSYGDTRRFDFRTKVDHKHEVQFNLTDNTALFMSAYAQLDSEHAIQKSKSYHGDRINCTARMTHASFIKYMMFYRLLQHWFGRKSRLTQLNHSAMLARRIFAYVLGG